MNRWCDHALWTSAFHFLCLLKHFPPPPPPPPHVSSPVMHVLVGISWKHCPLVFWDKLSRGMASWGEATYYLWIPVCIYFYYCVSLEGQENCIQKSVCLHKMKKPKGSWGAVRTNDCCFFTKDKDEDFTTFWFILMLHSSCWNVWVLRYRYPRASMDFKTAFFCMG